MLYDDDYKFYEHHDDDDDYCMFYHYHYDDDVLSLYIYIHICYHVFFVMMMFFLSRHQTKACYI